MPILCLAIAGSTALAQITTADVLGTVTDQTCAIVPQAKITLKNLGTGVTATTTSNNSRDYIFNLLTPGHYSIVMGLRRMRWLYSAHPPTNVVSGQQ